MNLDFGKAFSFIFDDDEWIQKILIAGLIGTLGNIVLGLGNVLLIGWVIEIARRVMEEHETPLPEWDNIGEYFMNGLKYIGTILIWVSPILILLLCVLIPVSAFVGDSDGGAAAVSIISLCVSGLGLIFGLLIGALQAPLMGLVAEGQPFTNLINPRYAFDFLKSNVAEYLVAGIVGGLVASFVGGLGVIACGLGLIFTVPLGQAFMGNLVGQAHRNTIGDAMMDGAQLTE